MNFEVLAVPNADPGYGQYNVGPTTGAQYYEGTSFTDVHDDGTTSCGQAQSMPAVVSHFAQLSSLKGPEGESYEDDKPIEQGSVVLFKNFAAVVPSYVEKSRGPTHVPLAVAGTTMVKSTDVKNGDQEIFPGQRLYVDKGTGDDVFLGISLLHEPQSSGERLVTVYL